MTSYFKNLKGKRSDAWAKATNSAADIRPDPQAFVDQVIDAAHVGNRRELKKLLANGGLDLIKRGDKSELLYFVENVTPKALNVLLAQPGITNDDKVVYLRNAVYHNRHAIAEILLKDPAIATQKEKDELLVAEFISHKSDDYRIRMGWLLVEQGADLHAAFEVVKNRSDEGRNYKRGPDAHDRDKRFMEFLKRKVPKLNAPETGQVPSSKPESNTQGTILYSKRTWNMSKW